MTTFDDGYPAVGAEPLGAIPGDVAPPALTLERRIAAGEEPAIVYLAKIRYRDTIDLLIENIGETVGTRAIAAPANEGTGFPEPDSLTLGDGDWCGRPDDVGWAHVEADPRLLDPGEIEVRVPYGSEAVQRAELRIARLEAINDDGFFTGFEEEATVAGGTVELLAVEAHGYASRGIRLYRSSARNLLAGPERAIIEMAPIADRLDASAVQRRFGGTGGPDGTPEMAGLGLPQTYGEAFNVPGVLIDPPNLIGMLHNGEVQDFDLLESGVARIAWDGRDLPSYAALLQSPPAPGFYTKARKVGLYALGDVPVGPITANVRGAVLAGVFSATTAAILGYLFGALLPQAAIAQASFGVLPDDPIGLHVAPEQEVTIAQLASSLLRPFGGFYGDDDLGRLRVGVVNAPGDGPLLGEIEEDEILGEQDPQPLFDDPEWKVEVTWGRNWRVMSESEIALTHPDMTPDLARRLQQEEQIAADADSTIRIAYPSAVPRGGGQANRTRGYFAYELGARRAAQRLRYLTQEPVVSRSIEVPPSIGIRVKPGSQWLFRGKPAVCVRQKLRASRDRYEIDLVQYQRRRALQAAG